MNAVERFKTVDKLELFEPLKAGQSPKYMVFSCADARVCRTLTFGLQPGEAFTVRNIASMVTAYDERRRCSIGSAIEFAVVVLKVKIGLVAKKVERENMLLPFDDRCTVLEKEVVNLSLRNLQSYPFVKEKLEKGTLKLIGARYDFVYGSFEMWDP
ncbi:hypothetical protein E2562_012528 [Oryza meyeriana var. granulata]|uniref:Carbonic anhydrase n=1 Tax=Oryza meyeriana var. granulata TaxID=110450 RepID=A0A6G1D2Z5_9ORYZ|nr:hypothetical protein E2562_012528 [Oryza meyeriana var. granulata]